MRAHKSRAVGVALIAAWVGMSLACFREPDDSMFVVGRITDSDGAPRPGQAVTILRNGDSECASEFHARAGGYDAGTYEPFTVVETNGRGDFLFELSARDARPDYRSHSSETGGACFRARVEEQGVVAETRFRHHGQDIELTDLVLPAGGLQAEGAGASFAGQWATAPTIDEWVVRAGREVAWRQDVDGGAVAFTAEQLEDLTELTVSRRSVISAIDSVNGPLEFHGPLMSAHVIESAAVAIDNPFSSVPLSRGPACPEDADAGTCAFTDGKMVPLSLYEFSSTAPGVPPSELTVDLGRLATPRLLVARGLDHMNQATTLFVEAAEQAAGPWTLVATHEFWRPELEDYEVFFERQNAAAQRERGDYLSIAVEPSSPVRFVRVRGETRYETQEGEQVHPTSFFNVRELSVFE